MIPVLVLGVTTVVLQITGAMDGWMAALRGGFAAMFAVTASAHWGRRRPDLVRMVPPRFGHAERWVTVTGWLEIAGAIGLLIPRMAPLAAGCLAVLLVALFPANVRAAREQLSIGGVRATPLVPRTLMQLGFIVLLAALAAQVDPFH